jgi:hypothetical protein
LPLTLVKNWKYSTEYDIMWMSFAATSSATNAENIDELVHVRLEGPLAKLLVKVNETLYSKYIVWERGKPVIYVKLLKALYDALCYKIPRTEER